MYLVVSFSLMDLAQIQHPCFPEDDVKLSDLHFVRIERIRDGGGAEITSQSLIIQRRGSKDAALSSAKKHIYFILYTFPLFFSNTFGKMVSQ
ncbi:MAG: hypothetical protein IPM04_14250 [Saprospiraceae bacterium]|nr:hypothetical protein [Candidatus Brachybacter algidus]MBK8748948.1 hypothetical protein [Candidatus Brachybacter algidus]